jgi:hypothetical protein
MSRDVLTAVVDALKADASVTALVSTRVFAGELPPAEAEHMPRKAVVVQRVSGSTGIPGYMEVERGAIDCVCWGETIFEAEKLRQATRAVLKQLNRRTALGTLIHSLNPFGGANTSRDGDTQWPFSSETWEFLASEIEAT